LLPSHIVAPEGLEEIDVAKGMDNVTEFVVAVAPH
jgi:hypothetical protein